MSFWNWVTCKLAARGGDFSAVSRVPDFCKQVYRQVSSEHAAAPGCQHNS